MKIFDFQEFNGVRISLPLRSHLTYVLGDSGTGKTYLFGVLESFWRAGLLNRVTLIDDNTLRATPYGGDFLKFQAFLNDIAASSDLIVFDRAEFLSDAVNDNLYAWCTSVKTQAYIVVMDRLGHGLTVSEESRAELVKKETPSGVLLTLTRARGGSF